MADTVRLHDRSDHGQSGFDDPPPRVRLPELRDLRRPGLDVRLRPLRRLAEERDPDGVDARDGLRARRHRRPGQRDHPQPARVGGLGPRRRLHRPARRLPHVQAPLPRRPARQRAMRQAAVEASRRGRAVRPDGAASVQPDVPDAGRRDAGRGVDRVPAPGDGAGHLHQLQERAAARAAQAAVRDRAPLKPPFGSAQVGKSFRNEITLGNFLFRVREFEQMEMEFFVPPDQAETWYRYWIEQRYQWYVDLGVRDSMLRVREHAPEERSHYSSGTSDIEYEYPIGWQELEGIANRGDFDLTQHTQSSGTKLEFVGQEGDRYTPHVVEPAVSIERIFVAMLCDAYDEEVVNERERTVLRLHPAVAPVKAAILPLISRDEGMATRARALFEELRKRHWVEHDDSGQIGRRYRRQDEIGTPWAFTIDEQTVEDETVTVRDRDSLAQERIPIAGVAAWLDEALARPWRTPKT